MPAIALEQVELAWYDIAPVLFVPHSEGQYQQLVAFLDTLVDQVGEDETHPLAALMEIVGVLITQYEDEHVPELTLA